MNISGDCRHKKRKVGADAQVFSFTVWENEKLQIFKIQNVGNTNLDSYLLSSFSLIQTEETCLTSRSGLRI